MVNARTKIFIIAALVFALIASVAAEQKSKPVQDETPPVLKEVIGLSGTCWEDHVKQKGTYTGSVVRWLTVQTGKIQTYGFVSLSFSAARAIDEASHPTVYHMPDMISFEQIELDTDQPNWVVHGVSDRGENEQGFDSTCELTVVKRGTELPNPVP
jgi:hypothetical protein